MITILLIPYLIIYSFLAIFFIEYLTGNNWILDLTIYCLIGLLWIPPTLPIINWLAKYES